MSFLEDLHALLVFDAFGFEPGDGLGPEPVELGGEHRPWVLQRGLDDRDGVERPRLRWRQARQHVENERPERLVEGEVGLQMLGDPHPPARLVGGVEALEGAGGEQGAVHGDRRADVGPLRRAALVVVGEQVAEGGAAVAGPVEDAEQHGVGHLEARAERLGWGGDQPIEGVLAPGHETLRGLGPNQLAALLRVVSDLGQGSLVLDDMFGGLDDDTTFPVEAGPPGPARDLVELAGAEQPADTPVIFGQTGQQHSTDGDIDADAESVGAADDLEQSGLGQTFDQTSVTGQHPGVVDADPGADISAEGLAEAGREAEAGYLFSDAVPFAAAGDRGAGERLSSGNRVLLGEVHYINGALAGGEQSLDGLVDRGVDVGVVERHGPGGRTDHRHGAAGAHTEVRLEAAGIPEGGRHEQELGPVQFQQRDLPGPAAVRVGVEVELVHDHLVHRRPAALAQSQVGENFGGGADDRGLAIDSSIASGHPDPLPAKFAGQIEKLLRHQRLDRSGIPRAAPLA